MIYFDSAATSFQKPSSVIRAFETTLKTAASPGRGACRASLRASEVMLDMREDAAAFFLFSDPERIVMTMNATHALNTAIRSLVSPGDRVVISGFEHNAVVRPLYSLGVELRVAGRKLFNSEKMLDEFRRELPGAKAAVCTHVSNVFGYVLPIKEIGKLCKENGVPLIIDASQSAGVFDFDCRELEAAFIAMPDTNRSSAHQGAACSCAELKSRRSCSEVRAATAWTVKCRRIFRTEWRQGRKTRLRLPLFPLG